MDNVGKALRDRREDMIERQLVRRGIRDARVLEAMRETPREDFVPHGLEEFAYQDAPLPIGEGQTISQPYIVALMSELLEIESSDRILDVGTGSGYAAAVLSRLGRDVYTIERHSNLAGTAERRFDDLGYDNVHVMHGDGTRGWAEHAPYDAIMVAAGSPDIPQPLLDQLAIGGRLIIPTGDDLHVQRLVLVRRMSETEFDRRNLGRVQFVPLIGTAGWAETGESEQAVRTPGGDGAAHPSMAVPAPARAPQTLPERIMRACEPIGDIDEVHLDDLLDRIGDARVVCIGEATHGTSEFYRMRARITQELIREKGFTIVSAEADWPDAAKIDAYVRDRDIPTMSEPAFARFPSWMWANEEVLHFITWLREYNQNEAAVGRTAGFFGLDLYSLFNSIGVVLDYLEDVDPETARLAKYRYGCLTPYNRDPAAYGRATLSDRYRTCEKEVLAMLDDLLDKRIDLIQADGERFFDAIQNARLVRNAEKYYREMYYGSARSWNLRDTHMFETLKVLLESEGPEAKAVVWAHNSHLGDASATDMSARGQINVGSLCRQEFADDTYLIGFGTHEGTVAAASDWNGPMEVKTVLPSLEDSYERLCHEAGSKAFLLPLTVPSDPELIRGLAEERLERAIGVIYRPETERQSHYFHARLPEQFDEYIWFDRSQAVSPLGEEIPTDVPETYPFGL